jgi:predicted lipoprotein with Yx(FWY)xxD motif
MRGARALWLVAAIAATPALSQTLTELNRATPPDVKAIEEVDRFMFVGAKGMALYTLDDDKQTPGTSACLYHGTFTPGGLRPFCAHNWPPLLVAAGGEPIGDWTIIKRPEGALQWAYKGMPVYYFEDDLRPGIASGDNSLLRYHVLAIARPTPTPRLPPGLNVAKGDGRWIIADHDGRLLYTPKDAKNVSPDLVPVAAAMLAQPVGKWTILKARDGSKQWAYLGKAAYVYGKPGVPSADLAKSITTVDAAN